MNIVFFSFLFFYIKTEIKFKSICFQREMCRDRFFIFVQTNIYILELKIIFNLCEFHVLGIKIEVQIVHHEWIGN